MHKLITTLIISYFLLGCESAPLVHIEVPPVPVFIVKPIIRDVPLYVDSVGILEPSFFIELRPQVSGVIEQVLSKEGAEIKVGMPLFHIEDKVFHNKVKEAEAQYKIDHAAYEAAKKTHKRFYSLAQKDLVAQTEWDEIETQLAKAEAVLSIDQARIDAAALDYEHCTLFAPADGRLGRLNIHPGTLVSREQATPLATLSRNDPLIVNFTLTEKEFGLLPKEEPLSLKIQLLCTKECKARGKITFLDSCFDRQSGLLCARGEIQNSDNHFSAGQSVRVRVPISTLPKAMLVPQKAVKYGQEGPYVFIVSPEKSIELRLLSLGEEDGEDVLVQDGLKEGESIVVSGHGRLSPGIKVEIQP